MGGVYWERVREMRRYVLYLKPRALLMLDMVIPNDNDVDITLLYQTPLLRDISTGSGKSTIAKDNRTLHIEHLYPENVITKAEEVPHSARVIARQRPLEREGMLTLTSRTTGNPLVIANFLTTTASGMKPSLSSELRSGYGIGEFEGISFAYSTTPGSLYDTGEFTTDALALTWKDGTVFAAVCTILSRNGKLLVKSGEPITIEFSASGIKYCSSAKGSLTLGVSNRPTRVLINGKTAKYSHDRDAGTMTLFVTAGEGTIDIR